MKSANCAALGTPAIAITQSNCNWLLDQAQRIGYFEIPLTATVGAATDTTILTQAPMTAALADVTAAKMILPKSRLYEPALTGSEAVNVGNNDNTTPNGKQIYRGQTYPGFTAKYTGLTATQYEDFENLFSRGNASADFNTIGGIFFLGDDQLLIGKDNRPIPFQSLFIGDPTGMQLHDLTQFMVSFQLVKGWYRNVKLVTLSYNHNIL